MRHLRPRDRRSADRGSGAGTRAAAHAHRGRRRWPPTSPSPPLLAAPPAAADHDRLGHRALPRRSRCSPPRCSSHGIRALPVHLGPPHAAALLRRRRCQPGAPSPMTHQLVGPLIAAVLVLRRRDASPIARAASLLAAERRPGRIRAARCALCSRANASWSPSRARSRVLTDLAPRSTASTACTAAALGCDFSNTYLIDERARRARRRGDQRLRPGAARADPRRPRAGSRRRWSPSCCAGRTVVINDPTQQTWFDRAELDAARASALALTPITAKGQRVGVLTVTRTTTRAALRRARRSRCSRRSPRRRRSRSRMRASSTASRCPKRATATSSSAPPT